MGELVSHKHGRHFSCASVFSAINLFGSTFFLDICMHQQHFVQRIFYHFTLLFKLHRGQHNHPIPTALSHTWEMVVSVTGNILVYSG
jgi:hypothetical protein